MRRAAAICAVLALTLGAGYPKVNLANGYKVDETWPKSGPDAQWRYVTGVTVDAEDRVWTLNQLDPPVRVYDQEGKLVRSWGAGEFKAPHYLRLDHEGNVWATDYKRHLVRKFSPDGELLLSLGVPDEAGDDDAHFNGPTDVAVSPDGDLFITDGYGNNRVVHYDAQGTFVKTWGSLGQDAGQLSQPHSIAMDSQGRIYVAERNNARIQIFNQAGESLAQWRNIINPWGIVIRPKDEIYVIGSSPARWTERGNLGNPPHDQLLIKFNTTGRVLELWAFPLVNDAHMEPGKLDWGHGLGIDSQGNLYIGDVADNSPAHRVQKFVRLPAER